MQAIFHWVDWSAISLIVALVLALALVLFWPRAPD